MKKWITKKKFKDEDIKRTLIEIMTDPELVEEDEKESFDAEFEKRKLEIIFEKIEKEKREAWQKLGLLN